MALEDDFLGLVEDDTTDLVESKDSNNLKEDSFLDDANDNQSNLSFPKALKEMVENSHQQKIIEEKIAESNIAEKEKEARLEEKKQTKEEILNEREIIKNRIKSTKKPTGGSKGYIPKTQEEKDLVGYNQVGYAIYDNSYIEENALNGLSDARAKHGVKNEFGSFVASEILDAEKNVVNAEINNNSVATSMSIPANLKKVELNDKAYLMKFYPEVEKLLNENLIVKDENGKVVKEGDKSSLIQMLVVYALDKLKEEKKQLVVLYNNTKSNNNTLSEDLEIEIENMKVVAQRYKK